MAWRGPPQFGTLARGRLCPLERSPIPQRPAVATASQRAKTRTATRSHPHPSPSRPDRARPALPQGLAATTSLLIYLAFSLVRCRYRAERLANRASQPVENPWNTIPVCSRGLTVAGRLPVVSMENVGSYEPVSIHGWRPGGCARLMPPRAPVDSRFQWTGAASGGVGCGGRLRGGGCRRNVSLRAVAWTSIPVPP
jgi:hypothetical protein